MRIFQIYTFFASKIWCCVLATTTADHTQSWCVCVCVCSVTLCTAFVLIAGPSPNLPWT